MSNLDDLKAAAETLKRELPLTVSDTELVNSDGLVLACVYGPYEACSDPLYANALALAANALPRLLAERDALAAECAAMRELVQEEVTAARDFYGAHQAGCECRLCAALAACEKGGAR